MKYRKYILICSFLFLMAMPLMSYTSADVAETTQDLPAREEVLWTTGYWAGPSDWNLFFWSEAWGTFFMYMPLFEFNFEKNELMGMIGESMEWNTDGTKITIKIRPEAEWSDGTDITVDDVIYNYEYLLGNFRFGGFGERVTSMTKVDAKTLEVNLDPNYAYSRTIWEGFIGYNKIGPKHVWEDIVDTVKNDDTSPYYVGDWGGWELPEFHNNWLEAEFPAEWKVSSGAYQPYYVDPTLNKEIYKRVEDWWGNDILGEPKPEYIGQLHMATNFAVNTAFAKDEVDWYGGYYPRIWELLEDNPNIHCWVDEDPYFLPISGMVELVPNHFRYPFDQQWLREALAWAINYEDMSEVAASGYLEKARAGYIDDRSPTQDQVYDEEVEKEYAAEYNLTKAQELLAVHAFKHTDGKWYTKDTPLKYEGTPGRGGENITDELAEDPAVTYSENLNVKLDDWDIIVVYGWSDSMMQTTLLSTYFTDIGITTTPGFIEYGTYMTLQQSMNFDLMNWVMGFAPQNTVFEGLNKFRGAAGQWVNFSGWYSPEFSDLMDDLEVTPEDSTEEQEIVSELQEILASTRQSIPISPNGFWYAYNDKYWTNWPNEKNPYIQATAPWSTGRSGAMQLVIYNIKKTGEVGTPWNFTAVLLGFVAAGLIVVRKRKK